MLARFLAWTRKPLVAAVSCLSAGTVWLAGAYIVPEDRTLHLLLAGGFLLLAIVTVITAPTLPSESKE